MAWNDLL